MLGRLFFVFTAMTLLEVYVLMSVGSWLGAEVTIGIIILTAFIGSYLVRNQGLQTVQKLQARLALGEMPGLEIVEGIMLLICGVLLVTPGFVTDGLGLLVLTPTFRTHFAQLMMTRYKDTIMTHSTFTNGVPRADDSNLKQGNSSVRPAEKNNIIEGDFVEVDQDDKKLKDR